MTGIGRQLPDVVPPVADEVAIVPLYTNTVATARTCR